MNADIWIAFGTGFIALVALIISSVGAARARVKSIEDAYIARYWQILDRFPSPGPRHPAHQQALLRASGGSRKNHPQARVVPARPTPSRAIRLHRDRRARGPPV